MKITMSIVTLLFGLTLVGCDDSKIEDRYDSARPAREIETEKTAKKLEEGGETTADSIEDADVRRADNLEGMDDQKVVTEIE